jgi:hypothetical protein
MIVGSEEKNGLDVGANPTISTNKTYYYSEQEWSKTIGWGKVPDDRNLGMTSFDRAASTQVDDPPGD